MEKCYYFLDGRCMLMIMKNVEGADKLVQGCVAGKYLKFSMAGCYRTKEQIEEEHIESKDW